MKKFRYVVKSPTKTWHRATLTAIPSSLLPLEDGWFSTRCGYRVGDWSRKRWGRLLRERIIGSDEKVCRRCFPVD